MSVAMLLLNACHGEKRFREKSDRIYRRRCGCRK